MTWAGLIWFILLAAIGAVFVVATLGAMWAAGMSGPGRADTLFAWANWPVFAFGSVAVGCFVAAVIKLFI